MKYQSRYFYLITASLLILVVGFFYFILPLIEELNDLSGQYQLLSEQLQQSRNTFSPTLKKPQQQALAPESMLPILFDYARQSGLTIEHVSIGKHSDKNEVLNAFSLDKEMRASQSATHRPAVFLDASAQYPQLTAFIALLAQDAVHFSVGDFMYQPLQRAGTACQQLKIHMQIFADKDEGLKEKINKQIEHDQGVGHNPFCFQCSADIFTTGNSERPSSTSLLHTTDSAFRLQTMPLREAIAWMAERLKLNIMLSPAITGEVALSLHDDIAQSAFELLLSSHGLGKWQSGNVWFIAPRDELIKQGQADLTWQEVHAKTLPLFSKTWQLQYAKADEVARLLQEAPVSILSKRGALRVDPRTNIICIQDVAESINTVASLLRRIDVPVQQILIEARLVSIDHDYERELGIQFRAEDQVASEAQNNHSEHLGNSSSHLYRLALVKLASGSLLDVKLSALEGEGHAALISTPSLFTSNQQAASIEAGEEVPYQEVSEGGGTAIAFKKAVLGLKVTPQVLPQNEVMLKLQINQDRPSNRIVLGVPAITTRQIVTNVLVKAGQTVVLGGIYETDDESIDSRVPWVSNMPLIGLLLKQNRVKKNKRELLIFVTPKIMQ